MFRKMTQPASQPKPMTARLSEIPAGVAGTRATLDAMARLVRAAKLPPIFPIIRGIAVSIVQGLTHKDYAGHAEAVQEWVRGNIQFVRDVRGIEMLTPPAYLLRTRAGDCDDQAMLVAALVESIGLPARLVAGGPDAQTFVHVWAEVNINGNWRAAETTEPYAFGERPSFARYLVMKI